MLYKRIVLGCVGLWLGWFGGAGAVWGQAGEEECMGLLQKKAYLKAALCFEREASKMPPTERLTNLEKKRKGFYLRTAAEGYIGHADLLVDPKEQAFMYEKGLFAVAQAIRERLCLKAYDCQSLRGLWQEMRERVGYAKITVINPRSEAVSMEIVGYQYSMRQSLTSGWTGEIRPGDYTLKVSFPSGHSEEIGLYPKKNEHRTYNLPPKPPISTGVWVMGGIGLGLVGFGGSFLAVGYVQQASLQSLKEYITKAEVCPKPGPGILPSESCIGTPQKAYLSGQLTNNDSSGIAIGVGWGLVGVGAALVGGATIWLLLPRKEPPITEQMNLRGTSQVLGHQTPWLLHPVEPQRSEQAKVTLLVRQGD